jgi:hypothetical protein
VEESKVKKAGVVESDSAPPLPFDVTKINSLADLDEYTFFIPGIVFKHLSPLDFNPFDDFFKELNDPNAKTLILQFQKPFVVGLGSYSNVLFGIPTEHWEAFKAFVGQAAAVIRPVKSYARVRPQEVQIPDPACVDKGLVAPLINVTAFGLDTNKGKVYLKKATPELKQFGDLFTTYDPVPYEDTKAMADAIFSDSSDPYGDAAKSQET